ncbi:sigma-70 family RNA polymerase sigma factor [Blastopirellula sp. JC732]|uniref:Sigma-70 family RNA polymerase sigma factor n=1 Tax=Blastopirellula sediminis TaxID=2894196 RepID=A0A9X1MPU7_9BACT|nr:ECF-type sigma factor [Blastopirellula sediminis]MCC9605567.1 sigma-70 family RNA polymerase sigma factor [Blastopirellula sediminis]MCC9631133.1 sigma-70 family RNA polymerase sigma factor [Blastopirellula sediminis]
MSKFLEAAQAVHSGDPNAADRLFPLVYDELRALASTHLAREKPGHTLQPTALVHEAYLRLLGDDESPTWNSRGHFFSAAAIAIRRILIDHARRKQSQKRGGDLARHDLDVVAAALPEPREDLLALDEALDRLKQIDSLAADVVQLLYFGGLTISEAAKVLEISPRTTRRRWAYARAWLRRELEQGEANSDA